MPLKHTTETFLLILLAVVIAIVGIVIPTLPALPEGLVPWLIAFVVSAVYPLVLSQFFRTNRADYAFRLLHWLPAFLLVVWFTLQSLGLLVPVVSPVLHWFTWGWTLPGVIFGIVLLMIFALHVVRRWIPRMLILLALLVAFGVGGVLGQKFDWHGELASIMWQGDWWKVETGTGSKMLAGNGDEKNLEPSDDPAEEAYRERLRAIEQRRERISERLQRRVEGFVGRMEDKEEKEDHEDEESASTSSEGSVTIGQTSSMPTSLPSSGFGWGVIILAMVATYCGVLHERAKRRTHC